jgi:plasminogen activator inhibitor 1 RNA-binding protein
MDKPVQRAGKRNAGPEAPSADTPKPAAGGRFGRQANFTGSEQGNPSPSNCRPGFHH